MIASIKDALAQEHSKTQTTRIVKFIGNDKNRFKELMVIILGKDQLLSQRGAWVFAYCIETEPVLIQTYFEKIIAKLREEKVHDAIKRNFMRACEYVEIQEKHQGVLYDIAMQYVLSVNEAHAVRAFAMTVLFKIAKLHPELMNELHPILVDLNTYSEIPALVSRSKNILKEMKKIKT